MALINNIEVNEKEWLEVFSACAGQTVAIQTACGELVVKNSRWNIDLRKGILTFGKKDYPLQFIGTESKVSNTWLWGWHNVNGFDNGIISLANAVRDLGMQWHLRPLTLQEFDLNSTYNGHTLSMVSCALSGGKMCYYRCVHETGAVFVAFSGVPERVFEPVSLEKFASICVQCLGEFYLHHRIFIKSFLQWNGTPYTEEGNEIIACFPQELHIVFNGEDEGSKITNIHS